jgi:hypothetical protein
MQNSIFSRLFRSREYQECKDKIDTNLSKSRFARIIYADPTHPCNHLTKHEVREILNQTEDRGCTIETIYDTIYHGNGNESYISVGTIIRK